jgi:glycosyltransferase involved in cell wall biosynthesis
MCADASAACYVTRDALQRRYPPKAGSLAFAISSVRIPRESFADGALLEARLGGLAEMTSEGARRQTPFRLGFMGMMEHLYKAPDIVLRAVAICARQGLNVTLDMVGDGGCRPGLGRLAARLGIARIVRFLGALEPGASVFGFLDSIDLFVLPSRVEGLPRAMIEAMARGCPCIGSSVGGVPELLSAEDLVPPGDVAALARKITDVLSDTERMACMAVRNWKASKEYLPEVLGPRRQAFYHKVRELAEKSATSRCSY